MASYIISSCGLTRHLNYDLSCSSSEKSWSKFLTTSIKYVWNFKSWDMFYLVSKITYLVKYKYILKTAIVQSCSTLCDPTNYKTPGFPVLHSPPELLKLTSIGLVMPSNNLIFRCPLLLPSIFPSIRSFLMSCLFASGGQSIGASASTSVLQWLLRVDFL